MNKIKRKKVVLIAFITALVFGAVCGGLKKKGKTEFFANKGNDAILMDNKHVSADKDEDKKDDEKKKDARYLQKEIVSNLQDKAVYEKLSNEKLAWWIKRNNEHTKSECDNSVDLSKFDAYYVDNRRYDKADESDSVNDSYNEKDANSTNNTNNNTDNNTNNNTNNANQDNGINGKSNDKVMYLTFDCGYDNGLTVKILDILKKHNVPACFFVTKTFIRDNLELTKRMKQEGHQVGNHTCMHPSLPEESFEKIVEEINECAAYMREATGFCMDPYFRPPKGEYSKRVLSIAKDLGYKSIFWSIVYYDYDLKKQPGRDYVINHFEKFNHDGAIILMHNISSSNVEALEQVLQNMTDKGYRFASLNELE